MIFKRWLTHLEKVRNQEATKFSKLVDSIVEIAKSNNQSKNIRAISGKKEQVELIDNADLEISRMQNEYLGEAVTQAINEFKEMTHSPKESTPVCKADKAKRINFPKKKKRSN